MDKKNKALKMTIDLIESELMDLVNDHEAEYKEKYTSTYKPQRLDHVVGLVKQTKELLGTCKEAFGIQHEWQGLSNDRIRDIAAECEEKNNNILNCIDFYRAIEKELKQKNQ